MARKLLVEIAGDTRSLERSFDRAGRASQSFGSRMRRNLKFAAGGAALGGLALVAKGLTDSTKAALEADKAQTRLRGALKNANVSYAKYGKTIEKTIQRTSKLAALDDEDLSDSFAKLVRTTGDVEKAMAGMSLAADIARARNISLESATKIVEKAALGQFRGLKLVGVQVDKNATATEALETAQRKFAGSAERYGNSAAGAQDKLGVAFENLQEKIGQKLLPVLQRLALRLIDLIEWAETNWPKFRKAFDDALSTFKPQLEALVRIIRGVVNIVKGIIEGDWALVWKGFKQVAVGGVQAAAAAVRNLGKLMKQVGRHLGEMLLEGLKAGLKALGSLLLRLILIPINKVIDAFNAIGGGKGSLTKIPGVTASGSAFGRDFVPNVPRITVGGGAAPVVINGNVVLPDVRDVDAFMREIQKKAMRSASSRRGTQPGENRGGG